MKAVAWQSYETGDMIFIASGKGDYPVFFPYNKKGPYCLVCLDECKHVKEAVKSRRKDAE
jgi:hypothetical protein